MVGNKNYNCQVIVDDIYNEAGEKIYTVERHIENNGDYRDNRIFDHKQNVHI